MLSRLAPCPGPRVSGLLAFTVSLAQSRTPVKPIKIQSLIVHYCFSQFPRSKTGSGYLGYKFACIRRTASEAKGTFIIQAVPTEWLLRPSSHNYFSTDVSQIEESGQTLLKIAYQSCKAKRYATHRTYRGHFSH